MDGQSALAQPLASPAAQAAEFRVAKIAASRTRLGIRSGVAIPNLPSTNVAEDDSDTLRRSQNADRFANGVRSPLREDYSGLYEAEADVESSLDREAVERYLALQNQTEGDEGKRMQLRAMLERVKEKERSEEFQRALQELKTWLQKRQVDALGKGASLVDEGEFIEIVDTLGVALSTYQAVITIFNDSVPEQIKSRMPVPPLDFSKSAADVASAAGTISQLMKWTLIVFVLVPFVIAFQISLFTAFCKWYAVCNQTWARIFSLFSL